MRLQLIKPICFWIMVLVSASVMTLAIAYTAPLESRSDTDENSDVVWAQPANPDFDQATQQYVDVSIANGSSKQSSYISRVTQLEKEMRELRGELEQQSHKIRQMISLQAKLFQDIDTRLDTLTGVPDKTNTSPGLQPRADMATPSEMPKSPESEQRAYHTAYNLLRAKQYAKAKHAMSTFLTTYPEGEYAVNAHYWLGELSLLTGDNRLAAKEFETVITKYPASSKVSDAMLKMGLLYLEGGEQKMARQQFQKIVKSFPNTASANIAKKRLQTL